MWVDCNALSPWEKKAGEKQQIKDSGVERGGCHTCFLFYSGLETARTCSSPLTGTLKKWTLCKAEGGDIGRVI